MNFKYFKLEEFDSPDLPNSGVNMDGAFLTMLDNARDIAQIPFKINIIGVINTLLCIIT